MYWFVSLIENILFVLVQKVRFPQTERRKDVVLSVDTVIVSVVVVTD